MILIFELNTMQSRGNSKTANMVNPLEMDIPELRTWQQVDTRTSSCLDWVYFCGAQRANVFFFCPFFVRLCVRRTNIPLSRKQIKCKTRCRRVSVGVCFVVAPIHPYTHPSIHPSCSPTILSAIQPSWHPRPSQEHPSEPLACSTWLHLLWKSNNVNYATQKRQCCCFVWPKENESVARWLCWWRPCCCRFYVPRKNSSLLPQHCPLSLLFGIICFGLSCTQFALAARTSPILFTRLQLKATQK